MRYDISAPRCTRDAHMKGKGELTPILRVCMLATRNSFAYYATFPRLPSPSPGGGRRENATIKRSHDDRHHRRLLFIGDVVVSTRLRRVDIPPDVLSVDESRCSCQLVSSIYESVSLSNFQRNSRSSPNSSPSLLSQTTLVLPQPPPIIRLSPISIGPRARITGP